MWETVVIAVLILMALLYAQKAHYNFISESKKESGRDAFIIEYEKKYEALEKEFRDYKKRVDALSVKSSFKL